MATLRLFASARQAAGCGVAEFQGSTVGEILDEAVAQYGSEFEAILQTSAVWVNGDSAERNHPVVGADEVAVLPPVSGGMSDGMTGEMTDRRVDGRNVGRKAERVGDE